MKIRRAYTTGRCQDCGRERRTTVIRFWVNFMRYRVCADCIRAYRPVILAPSTLQNTDTRTSTR